MTENKPKKAEEKTEESRGKAWESVLTSLSCFEASWQVFGNQIWYFSEFQCFVCSFGAFLCFTRIQPVFCAVSGHFEKFDRLSTVFGAFFGRVWGDFAAFMTV